MKLKVHMKRSESHRQVEEKERDTEENFIEKAAMMVNSKLEQKNKQSTSSSQMLDEEEKAADTEEISPAAKAILLQDAQVAVDLYLDILVLLMRCSNLSSAFEGLLKKQLGLSVQTKFNVDMVLSTQKQLRNLITDIKSNDIPGSFMSLTMNNIALVLHFKSVNHLGQAVLVLLNSHIMNQANEDSRSKSINIIISKLQTIKSFAELYRKTIGDGVASLTAELKLQATDELPDIASITKSVSLIGKRKHNEIENKNSASEVPDSE